MLNNHQITIFFIQPKQLRNLFSGIKVISFLTLQDINNLTLFFSIKTITNGMFGSISSLVLDFS